MGGRSDRDVPGTGRQCLLRNADSQRKGSAFADVTRSRKPYYAALLEQVMAMFRSGTPPLNVGETLEIIRFIEAANESRTTGKAVELDLTRREGG